MQHGKLILVALLILIPGFAAPAAGRDATDLPFAAQVLLHKAEQSIAQKEYDKAIEVLSAFRAKGKKLAPGDKDRRGYTHHLIGFTIGNCYILKNDAAAALPFYREAVEKQDTFSAGWLNLAKCAYDLAHYGQAARAFVKGYDTAEAPTPDTLYFAAASFMAADENTAALEVFNRLFTHHPANIKPNWKAALVQVYLGLDMPRKALPHIEELSEITTGDEKRKWQEIRLYQYLSLQMEKKALAYVRYLIEEYPSNPKWWKGLAHLYLSGEKHRLALVALTVKGFLEPLTAQEKSIVADLNLSVGVPIEAVRQYEEILNTRLDENTCSKIVQGYLRLYQPEAALAWIEKGLAAYKSPRLIYLKAHVLYELADYERAAASFETAARQKERPGQAWLMAGYAAWHAGDKNRARKDFKQAMTYKSQRESASRAIANLREDG